MLKLYLNIYISRDIYGPDFEFDPLPPYLGNGKSVTVRLKSQDLQVLAYGRTGLNSRTET